MVQNKYKKIENHWKNKKSGSGDENGFSLVGKAGRKTRRRAALRNTRPPPPRPLSVPPMAEIAFRVNSIDCLIGNLSALVRMRLKEMPADKVNPLNPLESIVAFRFLIFDFQPPNQRSLRRVLISRPRITHVAPVKCFINGLPDFPFPTTTPGALHTLFYFGPACGHFVFNFLDFSYPAIEALSGHSCQHFMELFY